MLLVPKQVFDLDGDVVGESRKLPVQSLDKRHRVPDAIEEIWITKRDVLGARSDLLANVFQYDFAIYYAKDAVVDRDDGAMAAEMLASPARFRVTGNAMLAGRQNDVGIFRGQRKSLPVGRNESLTSQRNQWLGLWYVRRDFAIPVHTEALGETDQPFLELTTEDRRHAQLAKILNVHRRIQTVGAKMRPGI